MSSFTYFAALETIINGATVRAGSKDTGTVITYDGTKYDVSTQIVNTSSTNYVSDILWEEGDGGMDTFKFMWIETDADALLEIQSNLRADIVVRLRAGAPFIFSGSNDLFLGEFGADGAETVLANTVEKIRIKNNTDGSSADTTVNARALFFN